MKNLIKILFILSFLLPVCAQGQAVTWQREYPDSNTLVKDGYSTVQLEDNGYIVISARVPYTQGISAMRINEFGKVIWEKYYYGDNPRTIVKTLDGNYFIGASVLIKININGDLIWSKDIDSYNINLTKDGGFYICAAISIAIFQYIPSIKKYDSLGNLEWEKLFSNEIYRGGFSNCLNDEKGNLVLIGNYSPDNDLKDYPFIMKTDSAGNIIWLKKYSGDSLEYRYIRSIVKNKENNYMVSGSNSLCYVYKFDSTGNWLSSNYYDCTYKNPGYFGSLIKTIDNGLVLVGDYNIDSSWYVRLLKTDYDGNLEWQKLYGIGQISYGRFGTQTADSGFILTGRRDSFINAQLYIVKTDNNGNTSPWVNILSQFEYVPENFHLYQNYPNPFNPETIIGFELKIKGFTELTVHNLLGQEIIKLISKELFPGNYSIKFNISSYDKPFSSGIYFYSLKAVNKTVTKKMVIIK